MVLVVALALALSAFAAVPLSINGTVGTNIRWTPENSLESWMYYKIDSNINVNSATLKLVYNGNMKEYYDFLHNAYPHNYGTLPNFVHNYGKVTIKGPFFTKGQTVTTTVGPLTLDWGDHYVKRNEAPWENQPAASIYGWKVEGMKLGKMAIEAVYGYDTGTDVGGAANKDRPFFGVRTSGDIVKGSNLDLTLVHGKKETSAVERTDGNANKFFTGKSTNLAHAIFTQKLNNIGTLNLEGAVLANTNNVPDKDDVTKTHLAVVGTVPYVAKISTTIDKLVPKTTFTLSASDVHAYFAPEWRAAPYRSDGKGRTINLMSDRGQLKYGITAATKVSGFDLSAGYNWTGDKKDNFWTTDADTKKMIFDFLKTTDAINGSVAYTINGVKLATDASFSVANSEDGVRKRVNDNIFAATFNPDPDLMFWNIGNQTFTKDTVYTIRANASASTKLFAADAVAKYNFIWDKNVADGVKPIWHKVELNYTGYKIKVPGLADALTLNYNSDYWFAADKRLDALLPAADKLDGKLFFTTWQRLGLSTKVDILGAKGITLGSGLNFDNRYGNYLEGRSQTVSAETGRWKERKDPWYFDITANYGAPNGIQFAAKYSWPDNFAERVGGTWGPDTYVTVGYSTTF